MNDSLYSAISSIMRLNLDNLLKLPNADLSISRRSDDLGAIWDDRHLSCSSGLVRKHKLDAKKTGKVARSFK
jgi:hypothetical protein